jgi:alkylation response protein AidB-like acyl-CoA dehydrogenase
MEFSFTKEQQMFENAVMEFAKKEIIPVCLDFEDDPDGKLAHSVITKAAKAEILGLVVPEQYGGGGGRGMEANIALESLSYGDVGIGCAIGASWWGQTVLLMKGAPELKEEWFPKLASKKEAHLICMALTEPSGGSDVEDPAMGFKTLQTIATIEGDEVVLNGRKMWPSNFDVASLYVVGCTVDPDRGEEGSLLVLVPAGTKGLSTGKNERKMGHHADRNGEIIFDNVRVPKTNMLGAVGEGVKVLGRSLIYNRVGPASMAIGAARRAYDLALEFSKTRIVGGYPLYKHELASAMLFDMETKIHAARLLWQRAAWVNSTSKGNIHYAHMAKVFATDAAMEIATDAVELMGSYGYSKEYGVEKIMRDVKIIQIYIGSNEMLRAHAWRYM